MCRESKRRFTIAIPLSHWCRSVRRRLFFAAKWQGTLLRTVEPRPGPATAREASAYKDVFHPERKFSFSSSTVCSRTLHFLAREVVWLWACHEPDSGRKEGGQPLTCLLPAPSWEPHVRAQLALWHRCQPHYRVGHPVCGPPLISLPCSAYDCK